MRALQRSFQFIVSRVLLSAIASLHGGVVLRSRSALLCAFGERRPNPDALKRRLEASIDATRSVFCADFCLQSIPQQRPLLVGWCSSGKVMLDVLNTLESNHRSPGEPAGVYIRRYNLILIHKSRYDETTLEHELIHAHCDAVFPGNWFGTWASEAYANAASISRARDPAGFPLLRHQIERAASPLRLTDLLNPVSRLNRSDNPTPPEQAYATLFVAYLRQTRAVRQRAMEPIRALLAGGNKALPRVRNTLEAEFQSDIAEIERRFHRWIAMIEPLSMKRVLRAGFSQN